MRRGGPLERRTPLRRGRRRERPRVSPEARAEALEASGGACVACLHLAGLPAAHAAGRQAVRSGQARRADHAHHLLERRNFPQWTDEPLNMVGLCEGCHDLHERAARRVPWEALPARCQDFLAREARLDGAAERAVRTNYPPAGTSRATEK